MKYVITVTIAKKVKFLLSSGHFQIVDKIENAAQFVSEKNAMTQARLIREAGFEREKKAVLGVAPLLMSIGDITPLPKAAEKSGFVIKNEKKKFFYGRSKLANIDFGDAHYHFGEREKARAFKSKDEAEVFAAALMASLIDAVKPQAKDSSVYQRIVDEAKFTVEKV